MRVSSSVLITILLPLLQGADEGPRLRLKIHHESPMTGSIEQEAQRKRLDTTRTHQIVQFLHAPAPEDLLALKTLGIVQLRSVPDNGLLVAVPEGIDPRIAGVYQVTRLSSPMKVSRLLRLEKNEDPATRFLVEFHPDTTDWEARDIALREGCEILENPDLSPHHLLVEADRTAIGRLADWDEVAYVFPASWELQHGVPVVPCAGAVSGSGSVGQYIETVGSGWDGPGLGSASLNYSFQRLTPQLSQDTAGKEIERALQEWQRYVEVRFILSGQIYRRRNINILFASGEHGDPYPFDGPGHVLAHTFYPAPPNPEPIAGDVHLDEDEIWRVGQHVDLYSVVLHELGHSLGLGHSDNPSDVMYPYYRMVSGLSDGDIAGARLLYQAKNEDPEPVEPLCLTITAPTGLVTTTDSTLPVAGVTTGGTEPIQVTWVNQAGPSGVAAGSGSWEIPAILLATGENLITVTATDNRGVSVSRSLTVDRIEALPPEEPKEPEPGEPEEPDAPVAPPEEPPEEPEPPAEPEEPPASPDSDTTSPSLKILFPPGNNILTSKHSIAFRGTASDNVGVSVVTWSVNTGADGVATGTSFWQSSPIPLLRGTNIVLIHAYDAAGNHGWRNVVITRR